MSNLHFNGDLSVFRNDPTLTDWRQQMVPSQTSDAKSKDRIRVVQFGDGYSQRQMDGINSQPLQFKLVFKNRHSTVIAALKNFFRGTSGLYDRKPNEYFFWTPPEPYEEEGELKFTHTDYTIDYGEGSLKTLQVTFDQVFDP